MTDQTAVNSFTGDIAGGIRQCSSWIIGKNRPFCGSTAKINVDDAPPPGVGLLTMTAAVLGKPDWRLAQQR